MIGRKAEQSELMRMYESNESEFVAIYGRRRVGKTFGRELLASYNRFAFPQGLERSGL